MRIGVFDSGVGGLTVLRTLTLELPDQDYVYLGDTARLPYGTKSPQTIRNYSVQIMDFLADLKVDAIVIACNTASSQVPETEWKGIPIFNVITPGAQAAVDSSRSQVIGVLATRATVASQSYPQAIHSLRPNAKVVSQAAPLLVPLAEEGWTDDPITDQILRRYLAPLMAEGIDTLVLGCTHYPLLRSAIDRLTDYRLHLIDAGKPIASLIKDLISADSKNELKNQPTEGETRSAKSQLGRITFLATDLSPHTEALAKRILAPAMISDVQAVTL